MIAETFGVLPSAVAYDLENDPEQYSLVCLPMLRYAEAKAAYERAKDPKDLASWRNSNVMDMVTKNAFELARDRAKAKAK